MDNNEPSREAKAIIGYWERQREKKGTPFDISNGLAHPEWDYDNRNVIKTGSSIPDDAEALFDSDGYYLGFRK